MWVCLNDGFLSIVEDIEGSSKLMVRSRTRRAITNVFGDNIVIEENKGSDYDFRTKLDRNVVSEVIKKRIDNIDYFNFKKSVREEALHDAYLKIWTIMLWYQFEDKKYGIERSEIFDLQGV